MIAGDLAARQAEVVGFTTADLERGLRHRNDAPAERVGDFEAGLRHAASVPQRRRATRAMSMTTPTAARTAAAISNSFGYPDARAPATSASARSNGSSTATRGSPPPRFWSTTGLRTGSVVPTPHR